MNLIFNILFFLQAILLFVLIITRTPARVPGFEKSRNQTLDQYILICLSIFLVFIFQLKCR